jgi:hypothetical protein
VLTRAAAPSGSKLRLVNLSSFNDGLPNQPELAVNELVIFDRLAQTAGMSGTVTTEQTTNLPGSLPARASSGVGVFAFLRTWSAIGTTGTTFTCRVLGADDVEYTSPANEIPGSRGNAGPMIPIPWPAGVTGIKEVRGVALAGSTGTAGNLGIVYLKPLIRVILSNNYFVTNDFCWNALSPFPHIHDNACVGWGGFVRAANRPFLVNARLAFNYVSD